MKRRLLCFLVILSISIQPVGAKVLKWVDFSVPYESLRYAMNVDIQTKEEEKHISWINILALAGCRTGGKCGLQSVKKAAAELKGNESAEELAGESVTTFEYYKTAYSAVLGGLLGSFAIDIDGERKSCYGLKAYSPIAAGYGYSHCSDFGNQRSFGSCKT